MITRENAEKLLPIIKAYSEGKKIQFFDDEKWVDREILSFNSEPYRYRIKTEPKYRPFKDSEECWNEMQKHQPFGWIKIKYTQSYCIFSIDECSNFDYRFTNYLFADGTPFGIKEEE